MRPALSILFFTTLSGAGYGLWMWLGLALALDTGTTPSTRAALWVTLAAGFLLSTLGLLCSVAHLGQPQRAWRALSQWRSSWLSREGVAAITCAAVALLVSSLLWHGADALLVRASGVVLAAMSTLVVFCTARIYSSLPTIAAWRDPRVAPAFVLLALATGGVWSWLLVTASGIAGTPSTARVLALGGLGVIVVAATLVKHGYWRAIDGLPEAGAGAATGLDRFGQVRAAEDPHTEANYLTHEMGFVLARRHAGRLRRIAVVGLGIAPIVALGLAIAWPDASLGLAAVALASVSLGAFVERWLFFAEARHVVMRYYGAHAGTARADP